MNRNAQSEPKRRSQPEGPSLAELEVVIAKGLTRQEAAAFALLEIHERKLFRPTYGSFREYVLQRWAMTRARAYQLLQFARLKRGPTAVGTNAPENERQARALNAQGHARQREQDPVLRTMNTVANSYVRLPTPLRREFIHFIRKLLVEMEQQLNQAEGAMVSLPIQAPAAAGVSQPLNPAGNTL